MKQTDNSADNTTPPQSGAFGVLGNATELPTSTLSDFMLTIFRNCDHKEIRKALIEAFNAEPILARIVGNAFATWEANSYLDRPDKMPSDVMLRMVGSFDKDQQRDLLQQGLEHAIGQPVKFVDATQKNHKP